MPFYVFKKPDEEEYVEIFLKVDDEKKFTDENGNAWERVYTIPYFSMDTRIDPYSKNAFLEKTKKGGTVGDLFDLSKEMSEKRGGKKNDPIKKDYAGDWKEKRSNFINNGN